MFLIHYEFRSNQLWNPEFFSRSPENLCAQFLGFKPSGPGWALIDIINFEPPFHPIENFISSSAFREALWKIISPRTNGLGCRLIYFSSLVSQFILFFNIILINAVLECYAVNIIFCTAWCVFTIYNQGRYPWRTWPLIYSGRRPTALCHVRCR